MTSSADGKRVQRHTPQTTEEATRAEVLFSTLAMDFKSMLEAKLKPRFLHLLDGIESTSRNLPEPAQAKHHWFPGLGRLATRRR